MRLVDADILLTAFPKGENEIFRTSAVRGTIDACPTVDAIPAVHGRWKRVYLDHVAMGERPSIFYCSVCNQCIPYPVNYCPSCGADMRRNGDGEEKE